MAAEAGLEEMTEVLLEAGSNPNSKHEVKPNFPLSSQEVEIKLRKHLTFHSRRGVE